MRGLRSHGVVRVELYLTQQAMGGILTDTNPEIVYETPTTAVIDAHKVAGAVAGDMLGRGGILLCPRGFPAVTVRLKLRDGAAKSPCTCGLDSEIYKWIR